MGDVRGRSERPRTSWKVPRFVVKLHTICERFLITASKYNSGTLKLILNSLISLKVKTAR